MTSAAQELAVQRVLFPSKNYSTHQFAFLKHLEKDYGYRLEKRKPCPDFQAGSCPNGDNCPDSHQSRSHYNNLVCKHWLRGLCKKGAQCEFLHEYNLREMPECVQWSRNLSCTNGNECLYLHIDPMLKLPPCPHYERGFCPLGPYCGAQHVKRKNICKYYIAGFCPNGKECEVGAHPQWKEKDELPAPELKVHPQNEEEEEQERQRMLAKLQEEYKKEFGSAAVDAQDRDGRAFDRGFGGGRGRGGGKRGWKQGGKRMERY